MRRLDQEGVSPIIGFIIATVIFSASFYYVMESAVQSDPKRDAATEYTSIAQSLADVMLGTGRNWYDPDTCDDGVVLTEEFTPEKVGAVGANGVVAGRFGLADEACGRSATDPGARNNLSFQKFVNLYQAKFDADSGDENVDYIEARRSLGLQGQNVDFHIRTWPVLATVREILGTGQKDPNMRPMYLADYVAGNVPPQRPSISTLGSYSNGADFLTVTVQVSNTGSPTIAARFQVSFSVALDLGTITFTQNTHSIPVGGTESVSVQIRKTKDWTWDDPTQPKVSFAVSDALGQLVEGSVPLPSTVEMHKPVPLVNNVIVIVNMDRMTYAEPFGGNNKWPKAIYRGYNGKGQLVNNFDGSNVDLKVIEDAPGTYARTITNPNKNGESLQDTGPEPDEPTSGKYTVQVWVPDTSGVLHNDDKFEVVASAPGTDQCKILAGDYVPATSGVKEAALVDKVIENFENRSYASKFDHASLPFVAGGDVFADIKCSMNNDLPAVLLDANGEPTLDTYTTLIVGSNVDHNAMTSAAAKETIRDWVFAGGTLIVMGSDDQSVTWLQPIFHSSLETANGGLYTPDAQHAALNVPNQLDYNTYEYGTAWDYNAGADESFTHVVQAAGDDVLGIGNPGAFGEGKVILTSWRAYALTDDQDTTCAEPMTNCQALFMIHNLVTLSYRELYLDYGPKVPVGEPTGAQLRIGSIWHPELKQLIGIQLQVFVFPGGS